jgi:5-methyltetrahydrofolate--homocysteine methyltransferase
MTSQQRIDALKEAAKTRILILDGAWGAMIQRKGLTEEEKSLRARSARRVTG